MTVGISVTAQNNRLDEVTALIDGGAGAGLIVLYDGTRPATGGTATNEVATLTFSDPSFPAASGGAMTANAITSDSSATGGTATWFRVTDSASTFVFDGSVGTASADMIIADTTIGAGATVSCSSFVITEGND